MNNPLPHYKHWSDVPAGLLTLTALSREGKLPGGPAVATISYNRGRDRTMLYDQAQAVAKPPRTARQIEGVLLTRQTREATQARQQAAAQERAKRRFEERRADRAAQLNADLLEAHGWFTSWMADPAALVLDTETTGLTGQVIEVGLCTAAGEPVFHQRVRVNKPIEPGVGWRPVAAGDRLDRADVAQLELPGRGLHGRILILQNGGGFPGQGTGKVYGESRFAHASLAAGQSHNSHARTLTRTIVRTLASSALANALAHGAHTTCPSGRANIHP